MPLPPERIIRRAHIPDDIQQIALERDVELSNKFVYQGQHNPRANPRMAELLKRIYDVYQDWKEAGHNPAHVPADQFDYLSDPSWTHHVSQPTLIKAKKLLGIRSVRMSNKWYWTNPLRAPTEVQQREYNRQLKAFCKINNEHLAKLKERPSETELMSILGDHNYDVLSKEIVEGSQFTRRVLFRAKARLGVASVKQRDGWHWVYPAPVVQEWLMDELAEGPRPIGDLLVEGSKRGWSEDVIRLSAKATGITMACGLSEFRGRAVWRLR